MPSDQPEKQDSPLARVWRSFRRDTWPDDDRGRMRQVMNDLILHLHPSRVPVESLRFTYTFGLGGIAILLLLVQVLTGILLSFAYTPSPEAAYSSIIALQTQVSFGQLLRNLHHWSANLLLVVAFLHMLRVFYTAAFRKPREFNWQLGLALLGLVAAANFTGYLLPWDQLSYWAVTVGTSLIRYIPLLGDGLRQLLLGGPEVTGQTLSNFFALHIILIPLSMLLFVSYHIWRVRKERFTVPRGLKPDDSPRKMVTVMPHLVGREAVVGLVVLALLLGWATFVNAPLGQAADPNNPPNPTLAAWYFVGVQELLFHFHPMYGAFIIPFLTVIALVALPYLRDEADTTGIWFRSARGRWLAAVSFLAGVVVTYGLVLLDAYWLDWMFVFSFLPPSISNGLLPMVLGLAALWGLNRLLRRFGIPPGEVRLVLFTLLLAAFVTLTAIGLFLRGPDMTLLSLPEILP